MNFNAAAAAYLISSVKGGAGEEHPIHLRVGGNGGIVLDVNSFFPSIDRNLSLGLPATHPDGPKRFTDINSELVNGGDFCFENGYRLTEANRVYKDMAPGAGIFLMDPDWKPVLFINKNGDLFIAGRITEQYTFSEPDVPRREP